MDWKIAAAASTWTEILRSVAGKFVDDQIPGRAAQMSFYFFFSVFPILLIVVAILGLFLDVQWLVGETIITRLAAVAPPAIARLFTQLLDQIMKQPGKPLTWGILVTLWAASSGMVATIRGLNVAYAVEEERPWWRRRLVGLTLTLVFMLIITAAMLLMAYGIPLTQAFAKRVGLHSANLLLWRIVQWPVVLAFVLAAFNLLYYFAPSRPPGRWVWLRAGTLIAIALWFAASLGLKFYIANFANYNVAYGALGAVIVLLLWFYLTSIAILTGAEINAQWERRKPG
jgi:membrane protein